MAAANFSRDVLEMFYGSIPQDVQKQLMLPIRPARRFDFEIVRNNFGEWLCVWKNEKSRRQKKPTEIVSKDTK